MPLRTALAAFLLSVPVSSAADDPHPQGFRTSVAGATVFVRTDTCRDGRDAVGQAVRLCTAFTTGKHVTPSARPVACVVTEEG